MASRARGAEAEGTASGGADRLPRRFGRYLLFDRIGRGGMADIYLARAETEIGAARRVVVKQILPELSRDPRFAGMLIDEAKLVAGLDHANVARVHDLGRADDRLYIAMEYVEGYDLNQLLRRLSKQRIALPAQFAIFIVREVLAGLDFAHRKRAEDGRPLGIVHRDVSPSNVLVSFEGEVKLCDFGIAKALGNGPPAAPDGGSAADTGERSKVAGKAAYMSPEHARGEEIDARSDVFAAGIILYELCAGRRLYKGTEAEMLEMARAAAIPPLPERGLPEHAALEAVLARALARDPADRFETAAQMLRALDDYAMSAKLFASPLRFASFLSDHFEAEVVLARRQRERAAEALDRGPPVSIAPLEVAPLEPAPLEGARREVDNTEPTPLEEPPRISDAALVIASENTRPLPASPVTRGATVARAVTLAVIAALVLLAIVSVAILVSR